MNSADQGKLLRHSGFRKMSRQTPAIKSPQEIDNESSLDHKLFTRNLLEAVPSSKPCLDPVRSVKRNIVVVVVVVVVIIMQFPVCVLTLSLPEPLEKKRRKTCRRQN